MRLMPMPSMWNARVSFTAATILNGPGVYDRQMLGPPCGSVLSNVTGDAGDGGDVADLLHRVRVVSLVERVVREVNRVPDLQLQLAGHRVEIGGPQVDGAVGRGERLRQFVLLAPRDAIVNRVAEGDREVIEALALPARPTPRRSGWRASLLRRRPSHSPGASPRGSRRDRPCRRRTSSRPTRRTGTWRHPAASRRRARGRTRYRTPGSGRRGPSAAGASGAGG